MWTYITFLKRQRTAEHQNKAAFTSFHINTFLGHLSDSTITQRATTSIPIKFPPISSSIWKTSLNGW